MQLEDAQNGKAKIAFSEIEKQYKQAQKELEAKIAVWYQRLADNNGISLAEARQFLKGSNLKEFKWDVKEYIKYGKENALNGQWMKELENASAKFHITRLEALKIQTQQSLEMMFQKQLGVTSNVMQDVYKTGYYHTAYELQHGFNIGFDIAGLDQSQIEKVISKPWAKDKFNFSERIWNNKNKLIDEVHTELTQNIMLGGDPQKAIDAIAKKMNTSKYNAGRLVMTEEAYFSSAAQKDCFNELGVEQYEIVATLDSHTSDICRKLDGQHFPMKDYQAGVTAPPFHVYCRSTTVPYFDNNFGQLGERAARDKKTGKTYYVPDNMTYPEWEKTFVNGQAGGLTPDDKSDIIKGKISKEQIDKLDKLKQSGMTENDYNEYLKIINGHSNSDIIRLYKGYADKISGVSCKAGGAYNPSTNSLMFDYPVHSDMNRYGTLAHEYGHFFDAKAQYEGLNFTEIEAVRDITGLQYSFTNVASSSDEFLAAIRKDKKHIKSLLTDENKADLIAHNASSGVQDAIDGLFPKSRLRWGHGEKYYNRKYSSIEFMDKFTVETPDNPLRKKKLQQLYKDLGFDASNQAKVKTICRQYEAASEAWANIMKAEVCGGAELEYVKKYLPNSYKAMLDILKGVK